MLRSIIRGSINAVRFPAPLILLFGAYLLGALVFTLPFFSGLNQTLRYRLAANEMARTFDIISLIEPLLGSAYSANSDALANSAADADMAAQPTPDESAIMIGLVTMAAFVAALALGLAMASSIPNVLLGGGALCVYADGRFTWRRFLWGCWHWALPFLALLFFFGLAVSLIILLGLAVMLLIGLFDLGVLLLPCLFVLLGLYFAVAMLFDYARAIAVCQNRRNIFWALARSVRFVFRSPAQALGLYGLMTVLGYLLIVVYNFIVAPLIPFGWALVAIGVQQTFVAAQLWARLARWGAVLALYQSESLPK